MGSNRIRKQNTQAELDKVDPKVKLDLLAFNLTKQHIVDLCNEEFALDPLEDEKHYSSFHRALDGHDTYVGIVLALNDLRYDQQTQPRKYLPKDDPGEDLAAWMAQFAKATWWYKLLDLNMTESTLNSWFSGRGKRDRPDVREQVEAWWERVKAAADMTERTTSALGRDYYHQMERGKPLRPDVDSWDTWCKDLIEDGVPLDEVKQRFISEGMRANNHFFGIDMIDLADPQIMVDEGSESGRENRELNWQELVERDFSLAVSRTPTEFDPTPYHEERQWGDRRNEDCPKDLNSELYRLHYRTRWTRFWDATKRCVSVEDEIVAVSRDGQEWRTPTERESRGWVSGFDEWMVAMDAGKSTDNLYTQELTSAEARVKQLEQSLNLSWNPEKAADLRARLVEAREDVNFAVNNY